MGRENGAKEFPDVGTHNGTHDSIIIEKVERLLVVKSYTDVTREEIKTPLGQNRLIISQNIYFIKVHLL